MSHRSNAADIYARVFMMLDNIVVNDSETERIKIVDKIKNAMSDYSWERYACGRDEEKLEAK